MLNHSLYLAKVAGIGSECCKGRRDRIWLLQRSPGSDLVIAKVAGRASGSKGFHDFARVVVKTILGAFLQTRDRPSTGIRNVNPPVSLQIPRSINMTTVGPNILQFLVGLILLH